VKSLIPFVTAAGVAVVFAALPVRRTIASALPVSQLSLGDPNAWKIDSAHSSPTFSVKHMLVSTVRGRMGPVNGTIWYDGKNVSSIRAEATIDTKAVSTGNDSRDKDLRGEEFFAVDKYPVMIFKSKRVEVVDAGHFKLIGDFTIRNNTHEVALLVEGPSPSLKTSKEERVAATATPTINRFDYGLKWNALIETGGAVVGPDVNITLDIEATRPPLSTGIPRR
jgi:polyisoprenoid-binding protein YceI